jgi:hypothetical protein
MPKIMTDNRFILEIFGSKNSQRSATKNNSFRSFGYIIQIQKTTYIVSCKPIKAHVTF